MPPPVNTGVLTVGVIVTVWVDVLGPLQPAAEAVMTEVPVHAAVKATTPVDELIELPAAVLAASRV